MIRNAGNWRKWELAWERRFRTDSEFFRIFETLLTMVRDVGHGFLRRGPRIHQWG